MRWRSIGSRVIWEYPPEIPLQTLLRHHRFVRVVVHTWVYAGILMMSSLAQFLTSSGWLQTVSMIVALVSCFMTLTLAIPAILCAIVLNQNIAKAIRARGCEFREAGELGRHVGRGAMKMCFWMIALMLIARIATA